MDFHWRQCQRSPSAPFSRSLRGSDLRLKFAQNLPCNRRIHFAVGMPCNAVNPRRPRA
jgi:hypothetical protein